MSRCHFSIVLSSSREVVSFPPPPGAFVHNLKIEFSLNEEDARFGEFLIKRTSPFESGKFRAEPTASVYRVPLKFILCFPKLGLNYFRDKPFHARARAHVGAIQENTVTHRAHELLHIAKHAPRQIRELWQLNCVTQAWRARRNERRGPAAIPFG